MKGYRIEFTDRPVQYHIPHSPIFQKQEEECVEEEIHSLISKAAISQVHVDSYNQSFLSNLFIVPKKGGGFRPVINLKCLNEFIKPEHFKMEGMHMLKDVLQQNDFMVKLDLKDAYLTIPLHKDHRKYLRFQWKGVQWEFNCLAFGLACAPRTFTKVLKPVVTHLRRKGLRLIIYLDDLLLMNQNQTILREEAQVATSLFQSLGFMINWEKSVLTPNRQMEFLGFMVDSTKFSLSLPEDKITNIRKECKSLLRLESSSIRVASSLLGKLQATYLAVREAPLRLRALQREKIQTWFRTHSYEAKMQLTQEVKEDLLWWVTNLSRNCTCTIQVRTPTLIIESDASLTGWGAFCEGSGTGGAWSKEESMKHINELEIMAAFWALKAFASSIRDTTILLRMDNRSAVAYLGRMGGTKSKTLADWAIRIWDWLLNRNLTLKTEYLPGHLNSEADRESRRGQESSDWMLDRSAFKQIMQAYGPLDIDLFASRLNTQLPRFFSWRPDPEAEKSDAFLHLWPCTGGYAFPPIVLIPKCLRKAAKECDQLVLVTPLWPGQPWFPTLLSMLIHPPILLHPKPGILTSPQGTDHPLVQNKSLYLIASLISRDSLAQEEFQKKLPDSSSHLGERLHNLNTTVPGKSGFVGVIKKKLVLFHHQ